MLWIDYFNDRLRWLTLEIRKKMLQAATKLHFCQIFASCVGSVQNSTISDDFFAFNHLLSFIEVTCQM